MKFVIISQVGNQEDRIYDWIYYHQALGFDTFIIFDDHSKDGSVQEIKRAQKDFKNINIILDYSDLEGQFYDVEQCKSSENYGHHSFLSRMNRSYNRGNDLVKKINPDAICTFIDQDEFIFTNSENVDIIYKTFKNQKCCQILVYSFDVKNDYNLEKGFMFKNDFTRWEYSELENSKYRGRCKPIFISKHLNQCEYVHVPIQSPEKKTYEFRNYDDLRILHFRKPNLPNSEHFKCTEDINFKNFLKKIK